MVVSAVMSAEPRKTSVAMRSMILVALPLRQRALVGAALLHDADHVEAGDADANLGGAGRVVIGVAFDVARDDVEVVGKAGKEPFRSGERVDRGPLGIEHGAWLRIQYGPMRTLVALPVSPWSEMARWALDHHRVSYAYEPYTPMLGEPLLRLRMRRFSGLVTVPVLFEGRQTILDDSLAIARHAEANGTGKRLFPTERQDDLLHWKAKSDRMMGVGREVVMVKLAASRDAQAELLPRNIPRRLRATLAPMAKLATSYMARKYDAKIATDQDPVIVETLDALREGLRGKDTLRPMGSHMRTS